MRKFVIAMFLTVSGLVGFGQADGSLDFIESGVTLKLDAPINPDGTRKFFLEVQTNDVYECSNFALEYDANLEGSKLFVSLKGVRRTNPCGQGMASARCLVDFSGLKPGDYNVRFLINLQLFKAKLAVTDSSYDFRIGKENPKLFRIINSHLNLIPDGTIWGKCEYTDPKAKEKALRFMQELENAGAQKTNLPVGSYDEFYLHRVGTTEPIVLQGERHEYPFVYRYAGDAAVLQEIMIAFRDQLKISLKTTSGKVFRNF